MAVVQDLERVTAFGTAGWVSPERELACSSFREAFLASLHDSFLVMGRLEGLVTAGPCYGNAGMAIGSRLDLCCFRGYLIPTGYSRCPGCL